MRNAHSWLEEYSESHRHPTNIFIHKICVPLIMFSVFGMLWAIPTPGVFASIPFLNWSTLLGAVCMLYYLVLSITLGVGMIMQTTLMFIIIHNLSTIPGFPLFYAMILLFLINWVFQFVGHKIEGKKPSFFKDLLFLLIGPLWVMESFYKLVGFSALAKKST